MFEFINDIGNYSDRVVDRSEVSGITVSTAYTSDEGYETALIDSNGVHPVERYTSLENAKKGHKQWSIFAKDSNGKEIVKLGGFDGFVDNEVIILRPEVIDD